MSTRSTSDSVRRTKKSPSQTFRSKRSKQWLEEDQYSSNHPQSSILTAKAPKDLKAKSTHQLNHSFPLRVQPKDNSSISSTRQLEGWIFRIAIQLRRDILNMSTVISRQPCSSHHPCWLQASSNRLPKSTLAEARWEPNRPGVSQNHSGKTPSLGLPLLNNSESRLRTHLFGLYLFRYCIW